MHIHRFTTWFLVFLTVFGCENPRIRTQIVHLPMREEFKDTIFVKKILWPKFSKNDKTNLIFPLKTISNGFNKSNLALERFSLPSTSQKLSTLFGIPPFSTNLFQLTSLLAMLVGFSFSFWIGAFAWFSKITKVTPFESVVLFRKHSFSAL